MRKQCVIDQSVVMIETEEINFYSDYPAMVNHLITGCDAFLLLYSTTSRDSFDDLIELHRQALQRKQNGAFIGIVAGTKCDLQSERQVTYQG